MSKQGVRAGIWKQPASIAPYKKKASKQAGHRSNAGKRSNASALRGRKRKEIIVLSYYIKPNNVFFFFFFIVYSSQVNI
jgi:hypothetical protein